MTPRARLIRFAAWAAAANLTLFAVAAALSVSPRASETAQRFLVLCGLAG